MSSVAVIATITLGALVAFSPASAAAFSKDLKDKPLSLQKYGGTDPRGDDPHGDDPREEQHDGKLPANKDRSQGKAPKDVYGGQYPNDQQPY